MEGSRALLVHLVEVMMGDNFTKMFSVSALEVRKSLEQLIKVGVLAARRIYKIMKKDAGTRSRRSERVILPRRPDQVLKAIGAEQGRRILCVSFSVAIYAVEDRRVWQMFFKQFCKGHYTFTFLNCGQYL